MKGGDIRKEYKLMLAYHLAIAAATLQYAKDYANSEEFDYAAFVAYHSDAFETLLHLFFK